MPIFQKLSEQNFVIAVLFSIVEKSNNYVVRCKMTPIVDGERPVSYEIRPLFTYGICGWKI